jgi:Na+/melibiose symporter-like transporter
MTTVPPLAAVADRRAYRHLFAAQVLALLATGIGTVALALLSYDLAGADAGAVFGTALAIKMATYIVITPVSAAFTARAPRRALLIGTDLLRATVALAMPFVTSEGQIYLLIFVFQAAAAVFLPVFQATVPELLPDEAEYAEALARARLAYDIEGAASPALAAALLLVIDAPGLFVGAATLFLCSAALIWRVALPPPPERRDRGVAERLRRGFGAFIATPRLRGLAALNLAAAFGAAMVTVNTVVLVQARLGHDERATAIGLTTFGAGSVVATLCLRWLLARRDERRLMLAGGATIAAALLAGTLVPGLRLMLPLWFAIGLGAALAQVPYGILIRRSAQPEDKPALYAAQFALSNAALMIAYPLAGRLGAGVGMAVTFAAFGAVAAAATLAAARLWPPGDSADARRA